MSGTLGGSSGLTNASVSMDAIVLCREFDDKVGSKGIFFGEDPLKFPFPILLVQLGLVTLFSGTLRVLLKPFRQPTFVADILSGIALGPSFLGQSEGFSTWVFPRESLMLLDACGLLGTLFFTFLVGIKTDIAVLKKSFRNGITLIIGIASFCVSMLIATSAIMLLRSSTEREFEVIVFFQSMVNFHGMYSILNEVKLLNSELGRFALSSSVIGTVCSWFSMSVIKSLRDARQGHGQGQGLTKNGVLVLACRLFVVFFVLCIWRPVLFWMIKRTPEGQTIKEHYVCTLSVVFFLLILYSEVMGLIPMFGTIILGIAVPSGPPLGSGLVDKLELFVSAFFLPSFFINVGRMVNVYEITFSKFLKVELIILCASLGKVVGTMVPSIYRRIPVVDAFLIGLVVSSQGVIDISFFNLMLHVKFITAETYSIMVLMATVHAGIIMPSLRYLYDPSRNKMAHKGRTIQHSGRHTELRILACIHQEDDVPAVLNVLEASTPTRVSPVGVYILELVELAGQAIPLLINHKKDKKSEGNTKSDRIIKAFHQYQKRYQGVVSIQCFTSVAPFATIHDDICSLARQKLTSLVIIPFQKFDRPALRAMQNKVLRQACCSVAILVDRAHGIIKAPKTVSCSWFALHVCVVFIGGPDDREALALGSRMAGHPNVKTTVVRIYEIGGVEFETELTDTQLDLNAVNDFRIVHADNSRVVYREEGVSDGPGTAEVLQSLAEGFDLLLVGRRHVEASTILLGLSDWCEVRELGVIGDILTSSDYKSDASVLVVQQEAPEEIALDLTQSCKSIQLTKPYL